MNDATETPEEAKARRLREVTTRYHAFKDLSKNEAFVKELLPLLETRMSEAMGQALGTDREAREGGAAVARVLGDILGVPYVGTGKGFVARRMEAMEREIDGMTGVNQGFGDGR